MFQYAREVTRSASPSSYPAPIAIVKGGTSFRYTGRLDSVVIRHTFGQFKESYVIRECTCTSAVGFVLKSLTS